MLNEATRTTADSPRAPAWSAALDPEPTQPAWMAPGHSEAARPEDELRVVRTTLSSVRPRSMPPEARPPSVGPGALDHTPDLELGGLRAPSVPAAEALALELEARTAELHEVIQNAAEAVRAARRQALETSEESLVRLACAIAQRVVGRELRTDPAVVRNWVREGIAALSAEDDVEVRVASALAGHLGVLDGEVAGRAHADVIVDEKLTATQIEIVGRYGRVAAGLEARFEAVCEALGMEDDK
jgi:hypothetical protein